MRIYKRIKYTRFNLHQLLPGSSEIPMSCFHSVTDESTTDAFSFAVSEDMSLQMNQLPRYEASVYRRYSWMVEKSTLRYLVKKQIAISSTLNDTEHQNSIECFAES